MSIISFTFLLDGLVSHKYFSIIFWEIVYGSYSSDPFRNAIDIQTSSSSLFVNDIVFSFLLYPLLWNSLNTFLSSSSRLISVEQISKAWVCMYQITILTYVVSSDYLLFTCSGWFDPLLMFLSCTWVFCKLPVLLQVTKTFRNGNCFDCIIVLDLKCRFNILHCLNHIKKSLQVLCNI